MSAIGWIKSFSILHAVEQEHERLEASDVLAGLYVYDYESLEYLCKQRSQLESAIRGICNLDEPLWIVRSRYFNQIFGNTSTEVAEVTSDPEISSFFEKATAATVDLQAVEILRHLLAGESSMQRALASVGLTFAAVTEYIDRAKRTKA